MESKFVKRGLGDLFITKENDRFCCVLLKESAHVLADGVNTRLARQENPKEVKNQVSIMLFFLLENVKAPLTILFHHFNRSCLIKI